MFEIDPYGTEIDTEMMSTTSLTNGINPSSHAERPVTRGSLSSQISLEDERERIYLEKLCVNGYIEYSNRGKQNTIKVDEQTGQFIAAGAAAIVSSGLFHPLDCLRIRWQVAPRSDPSVSRGLFSFGSRIMKKEGLIEGLWRPGLGANVTGMSTAAALRFGYYETIRDYMSSSSDVHSPNEWKQGSHMLLAGLLCGAFGYAATTPFHLLKTMIQAEKGVVGPNGLYLCGPRAGKEVYMTRALNGAWLLAKEEGILRLWRGSVPLAARGAFFTSGQMFGYDGMKTLGRNHGMEDGPFLHILASITASFWASFLSSPADCLMTRYMTSASSRNKQSMLDCARRIYIRDGITGYWRGWSLFFVRLTPSMLAFSTVYEQIRFQLGLGYF
mmetsp:Transcript_20915/g.31109  ORF Transcript_20915/g.31109 Transcript_20915/m.31109 type:complete len:385 (-) Transcript_20915:45-1199(-)